MNVEEVEIGESYRVDSPAAKGKWTVLRLRQNKLEQWEAECVKAGDEKIAGTKIRTFLAEKLIETAEMAKRKEKEAKMAENKIQATLLDEIEGPWGRGVKLWNVDVHFWPEQKRRGREKGATNG